MLCSLIIAAAVITAQPLVDEDVLEPSVQNEVDHAISLASTNNVTLTCAAVAFAEMYATNGMSATSRAVSLVSAQKGGKWFYDGADVTPIAVGLLIAASGRPTCGAKLELPAAEVMRLAEKNGATVAEAKAKAEKLGFTVRAVSEAPNPEKGLAP